MKKAKILVVGSFMMDLIASAPRVPNLGETVIGTSFQTAPGGKGANQALQCARLGADVTMVGCSRSRCIWTGDVSGAEGFRGGCISCEDQ